MMIPYERQEKIIAILSEKELLRIEELQEYISDISISTLRRDLKELEKQHKIQMLAGGAVKLVSSTTELPISTKTNLQSKEKEIIAQLAIKQINDGDTVYIDSGSTCSLLLGEILDKKIHVITTNTDAIALKGKISCEITLLGGAFNPEISSLSGPLTENNIKSYIFDKVFLGANGVDTKFGVTTPNYVEASKKRAVIEQSKKNFLLCDSSKFKKVANVKVCELNEVILISDKIDHDLVKNMEIISQ